MSERPWRLFIPRWKLLAALLVAISGLNIFMETFVVSKFRGLYQDALPGTLLPNLTQFILTCQVGLVVADAVLLLVGLWLVRQQKRGWLLVVLGVMNIQIALTVIALFLPMTMHPGMSNAP
jgi:uncharacterized membrane protein HdeD (DUF308 family)